MAQPYDQLSKWFLVLFMVWFLFFSDGGDGPWNSGYKLVGEYGSTIQLVWADGFGFYRVWLLWFFSQDHGDGHLGFTWRHASTMTPFSAVLPLSCQVDPEHCIHVTRVWQRVAAYLMPCLCLSTMAFERSVKAQEGPGYLMDRHSKYLTLSGCVAHTSRNMVNGTTSKIYSTA